MLLWLGNITWSGRMFLSSLNTSHWLCPFVLTILESGMTRIRNDIHPTLHVLEPASMALPLSHQAPSLLVTQCLCAWHLSETFKYLLISSSRLPAQPGQRKNDIWDEGEIGSAFLFLPPLAVSLGFLSTYRSLGPVALSFRNACSGNQVWKQCERERTWAHLLREWCVVRKLNKRGMAWGYLCPLETGCFGRWVDTLKSSAHIDSFALVFLFH